MIRLFNYLKSLMLVEFLQGLWLTLTHMFNPKTPKPQIDCINFAIKCIDCNF